MTVSTTTRRVSYMGDGTTTSFPVPFRFDDPTHLHVVVTDALGSETVQTLNIHYTVTGAGLPTGGTLTMSVAPAVQTTLSIKRIIPRLQSVDFTPFDPFPAETQERIADKLTMITQEDADDLDRALVVPESDAQVGAMVLPSVIDRAGRALSFDFNGLPIATTLPMPPVVTLPAGAMITVPSVGGDGGVAAQRTGRWSNDPIDRILCGARWRRW